MTSPSPALPLLLVQLDTCIWKIQQDQPVAGEVYNRLLGAVQAVGPSLDAAGQAQLVARVHRLVGALHDGQARITQNLRTARAGRRAANAYSNQGGGS
ncbi:MAG: hypothetical protein EXR69_09495 [Myxococcales bacterium]|nr:hypothetical protein [Myxococcales bacterium]